MEKFLTLLPPMFIDSGPSSTLEDAVKNAQWIATVNLWLIRTEPFPAVLYQQRSLSRKWAPGKLDVVVGGKVDYDETPFIALKRECKEEVHLDITEDDCTFIGRRMAIGVLPFGLLYSVPHIYFKVDNRSLEEFSLQEEEVSGIFSIDLKSLLQLHKGEIDEFEVTGLGANKKPLTISVNKESFPENFDSYHKRIATLFEQYFKGNLIEY